MTGKPSLIVTDHTEFFRAINGDEIRYFPANAQNARQSAIDYDEGGDFDRVTGYGVYDATISTSYAVALYATTAEAEAHEPAPEPTPPQGLFKTSGVLGKPQKRDR